MLNQSCIPGANPIWSWYIIFFICYCIRLAHFVEEFYMCIHKGYWAVVIFSYNVFIFFGYMDNTGIIK